MGNNVSSAKAKTNSEANVIPNVTINSTEASTSTSTPVPSGVGSTPSTMVNASSDDIRVDTAAAKVTVSLPKKEDGQTTINISTMGGAPVKGTGGIFPKIFFWLNHLPGKTQIMQLMGACRSLFAKLPVVGKYFQPSATPKQGEAKGSDNKVAKPEHQYEEIVNLGSGPTTKKDQEL